MDDIKALNKKIDALGVRLAKAEQDIQDVGLECLAHIGEHGDIMPLNRLVNVLRRGQHQAFVSWALAYTKVSVNRDKGTMDKMPLSYAKDKKHDQEGATANPWWNFADTKEAAVAKAFDLQAAVKALLKKASGNVSEATLADLKKIAEIAHVDASEVKAKLDMDKVEPAIV